MELFFINFLENMSLIIALMYLGVKVEELVLEKVAEPLRFLWLSVIFFGFLSLSIMFHPLHYEGTRLDLRDVPLFFITYIAGWKFGIFSAVLPGIFRISLGGATVLQGVLLTIVLPVLAGAVFHRKEAFTPPYTVLNIRYLLSGFVIYQLVKTPLMLLTTPVTGSIAFLMFLFSFIAIAGMGLMLNDFNQKEISRLEHEYYSQYDPMTQLPNMRYFRREAESLLAQKQPIAIAMVDVDYFKQYNDTHGHQAGDEVLKKVGKILTGSVRKQDFVARYGGEEFIICYGNVMNTEEVEAAAERFKTRIETNVFDGEETQPGGELTVSIGISFSKEKTTLDELIGKADKALYRSKQKGRNRINIYRSS